MGNAKVVVRFDAWKAGKVALSEHEVPVVRPNQSNLKLEAVSPRLRQEFIHPNRNSALYGLQFSTDGKRIIAGDYPGGTVVVWDVSSGKQLSEIETGYGTRSSSEYFHVSPDWKTLYVSHTKREYDQVEQNGKRLTRWQFDGEVRTWDVATGRIKRIYKHDPPRNISSMQLSRDGTRFVTFGAWSGIEEEGKGVKRDISVWDVETGRYRSLSDGLETYGLMSPDGRSLAVNATDTDGYVQALKLVDLDTCREKWSLPVKDKNVFLDLGSFSPDGRLLAAGYRVFPGRKKWDTWESSFKWYDTATGQEVASFPGGKKGSLHRCRFAPDGQTLAAVGGGWSDKTELFLFCVPDKKLVRTLMFGENTKAKRMWASGPVFSPNGKWVAVITQVTPEASSELDARDAPQARIHLIDVAAGEIRETLIAPQGFARSACFSPDGRTLATGRLGRVLLWDLSKPPGALVGANAR